MRRRLFVGLLLASMASEGRAEDGSSSREVRSKQGVITAATEPDVPLPESSSQTTTDAPPLPQHPDRKPEDLKSTRPPAARSDRGEPTEARAVSRRLPIPAQPARDLPEIGEPVDPTEAPPALFHFLPHSGPRGALNGEFIYTGETFTLAKGGINDIRTSNYRGNLDMVLTLDLEIAAGLKGSRLFVYGQNVHGEPMSINDVGDLQLFSNIDSTVSDTDRPHYSAIAEYWWEQLMCDDTLRWKVGKQDANADFAYSDLGGDFINSSFGLPPTVPLPTFPSQSLGVACFYAATERSTFGFGAYDGTPASGPQGVRAGFDTLGHNGTIMLGQWQFLNQTGPNGQLPTTIRLGGWYHTGDDLWVGFDPAGTVYSGNYGGWLIGDQMLWKEEYGTEDTQGLGGFCMLSWTKEDRNVVRDSFATGLVYRGLLNGRDEDLLGAGVAIANLGDNYIEAERAAGNDPRSREAATEVFYKIQVCPAVVLQPEMQYISHPGAVHRDALLFGLRFEAAL